MGALDWFDWKTDGLLFRKCSKHGTLVFLHTLPSTLIYTVKIYCSLGCSFETFARSNNAECFFTSKTDLTARRHFVCKLSWRSKVRVKFTSRYCFNISGFFFFGKIAWKYVQVWLGLVYSVCVVVVYFWRSIKSWNLSLLLLTLFASSFALVQLGLIFLFVPSFWSDI